MKIESIKFKAKRLDGKGWAIGDLLHSYENGVIIVPTEGDGAFSVDPSTVCMYTGLKDCDGNGIWEGDVLLNVTDDSPDGTVVFKYGAFSLLATNGRDFCVALTYLLSEKDSLNRFKVVGNKFDKEK